MTNKQMLLDALRGIDDGEECLLYVDPIKHINKVIAESDSDDLGHLLVQIYMAGDNAMYSPGEFREFVEGMALELNRHSKAIKLLAADVSKMERITGG